MHLQLINYLTEKRVLQDVPVAEQALHRRAVGGVAPRTRIERATCPLGGGCSIH